MNGPSGLAFGGAFGTGKDEIIDRGKRALGIGQGKIVNKGSVEAINFFVVNRFDGVLREEEESVVSTIWTRWTVANAVATISTKRISDGTVTVDMVVSGGNVVVAIYPAVCSTKIQDQFGELERGFQVCSDDILAG